MFKNTVFVPNFICCQISNFWCCWPLQQILLLIVFVSARITLPIEPCLAQKILQFFHQIIINLFQLITNLTCKTSIQALKLCQHQNSAVTPSHRLLGVRCGETGPQLKTEQIINISLFHLKLKLNTLFTSYSQNRLVRWFVRMSVTKFQLFGFLVCQTRPERPKGAKDEVKPARRATNQKLGPGGPPNFQSFYICSREDKLFF